MDLFGAERESVLESIGGTKVTTDHIIDDIGCPVVMPYKDNTFGQRLHNTNDTNDTLIDK